jgi:PEP-CTERM motif
MRKISCAVAVAAAVVSAPASAVIVGGIDFGVLGQTAHIETATLAETFINGVGQKLQGYGTVTTVNGNSAYCAPGPCTLYYYFHDYTVTAFNGSQVQFTGGVVDLYYSNTGPINLLNQNSVANVAAITALTPWVETIGHTFHDPLFLLPGNQTLNGEGTLTGTHLSENGEGLLDVTNGFGLAAVSAYLNGNSEGDGLGGFADITVTSSSNNSVLNPFDVSGGLATGCANGTAAAGAWCLQGTLNTRGATVIPEPGTLALVGLAFVGVGLSRRRKT